MSNGPRRLHAIDTRHDPAAEPQVDVGNDGDGALGRQRDLDAPGSEHSPAQKSRLSGSDHQDITGMDEPRERPGDATVQERDGDGDLRQSLGDKGKSFRDEVRPASRLELLVVIAESRLPIIDMRKNHGGGSLSSPRDSPAQGGRARPRSVDSDNITLRHVDQLSLGSKSRTPPEYPGRVVGPTGRRYTRH